jgi:hypothetical protein
MPGLISGDVELKGQRIGSTPTLALYRAGLGTLIISCFLGQPVENTYTGITKVQAIRLA